MIGLSRALAVCVLALAPVRAAAETIRLATYDVGLSRDGAGVLLHDLGQPDPAISAVVRVIQAVRPDVLLLAKFDHDLRGRALAAFLDLLRQGPDGIDYPHSFAPPVNAGVPSGLDLDGDGLVMGRGDALGWGRFPGNGGMALVSRLPIDTEAARTFRGFRWAELAGAQMPANPDGTPYFGAAPALPLSSRSHWDVPVALPGGGSLHVLAAYPTPPLFDGPEARNARRNHDEIAFWARYLDGAEVRDDQGRIAGPPEGPLVVLGDLNADPHDGAGLRDGIAALLAHPRLQDARPASAGAAAAADPDHAGPPELDTADWGNGPGNLRVDYVLPSTDLEVAGSGVFWPAPGEPLAEVAATASDHRLVWVDVEVGPDRR
jgi:hypothetical protein